MGDYIGEYYGVIKGDTRSLDYSSYDCQCGGHGVFSYLAYAASQTDLQNVVRPPALGSRPHFCNSFRISGSLGQTGRF